MPPTGTAKANDDAAAAAKAKAVATLQRLFFEEIAKGSQDPSGAAARALLRLSEAPQRQADSAEIVKPASIAMVPPPEMELPAEMPDPHVPEVQCEDGSRHNMLAQQVAALEARPVVPRRPSEQLNGARRPAPRGLSRVAVRG